MRDISPLFEGELYPPEKYKELADLPLKEESLTKISSYFQFFNFEFEILLVGNPIKNPLFPRY